MKLLARSRGENSFEKLIELFFGERESAKDAGERERERDFLAGRRNTIVSIIIIIIIANTIANEWW